MFFKSVVLSFLLLIGAEAFNSTLQVNQPVAASLMGGNYIVYQWIEGVRWAFEYSEDGVYIGSYPDPE